MLTLRRSILSFSALVLFSYANLSFALPSRGGFSSTEHITAGDNVKLSFTLGKPSEVNHLFQLSNGLNVTYGDILAFGDFYGLPDKPISLGETESERASRFLAAFHSFASMTDVVPEAMQIIEIMHSEKKLIEEALQKGESPQKVYEEIGMENNRRYNCITGGGCSDAWWLNEGRYLKLVSINYDHFGDNAWIAYKAGHHLAVEQARLASKDHDVKQLELAYAMNAFACHFISDRLSAGHIRTPRIELPQYVTPAVVGSLLSGYMHSEENANGIHVHNKRGDHWIAYGDGYYFDPNNKMNRTIHDEILQVSADEVFAAYLQPTSVREDGIDRLLPHPDEQKNRNKEDLSPLFYWDDETEKLMRREDIANVFDRHWTTEWWGWSTLIALTQKNGLTPQDQAALALAGLGEKALANGLITDKAVIRYIRKTN